MSCTCCKAELTCSVTSDAYPTAPLRPTQTAGMNSTLMTIPATPTIMHARPSVRFIRIPVLRVTDSTRSGSAATQTRSGIFAGPSFLIGLIGSMKEWVSPMLDEGDALATEAT